MLAVLDSAEIVAWVCFGVGIFVLFAGVWAGLVTSIARSTKDVRSELEQANSQLEEARAKLAKAKSEFEVAPNLESLDDPLARAAELTENASEVTAVATESTDAAKSAIQQVARFPRILASPGCLSSSGRC